MATLDGCINELAAVIAGLPTGGPIVRTGVIAGVAGTTVSVAGVSMPYVEVGVVPVSGRTAVYLRQGTAAVALGMLAS